MNKKNGCGMGEVFSIQYSVFSVQKGNTRESPHGWFQAGAVLPLPCFQPSISS